MGASREKYPRIARCCIENTIEKGATSVVFFVAVLPPALPKHKKALTEARA